MKKSYKNNKPEISAPTWNEIFDLLDASCYVSNIQDYYGYMTRKNMKQ